MNLLALIVFITYTNIITATETNSTNRIDILQDELNKILVQFCASEIYNNETTSAISKFGQLSNAEGSIKDLVQFYTTTENYVQNFDNLLRFIDHISSLELQQIAYNTLIDAIDLNLLNFFNVLRFENFIQMKFELTDVNDDNRKIYEELLSKIRNHIKELIVGIDTIDIIDIVNIVNSSNNTGRIFELIQIIVQGVDLHNFTDMNNIFRFSMQLSKVNQFKVISKVLSEIRQKSQYKHVFHVICQIKLLSDSFDRGGWTTTEKDLLSQIIREIPSQLRHLVGNHFYLNLKSLVANASIFCVESKKYNKNLLLLTTDTYKIAGWWCESTNYNSLRMRHSPSGKYLSVEYCFHSESFPSIRDSDNNDLTQSNWYILVSNDLTYMQIKNMYTNEYLISEDIWELANTGLLRRVGLSGTCSHCDSSKWLFTR